MPELPEVETVCRGIEQSILNKRCDKVVLHRDDIRIPIPANFMQMVSGSTIEQVSRRSKYIQLYLNNDYVVLIHLGMSGKLLVLPKSNYSYTKHNHVEFYLCDDTMMVFNDPRRFGIVTLALKEELPNHPLLNKLGPEPLTEDFSVDYLSAILKRKTVCIKNSLMDSQIVVGVGNIYAAESLFRSGIHPQRPSNSLTKKEIATLIPVIQQVLSEAIESGGSTLRDYVRSSGDLGYFQHKFTVYGREGEMCYSCGDKIKRIKQSGRSTFYCSSCQK